MVAAWRIVKRKHSQTAFSGEGARRFGGRWNSIGVPLVYTAGSISLAALELLVHLRAPELLQSYVVFQVEFEDVLVSSPRRGAISRDGLEGPATLETRAVGDAWAASGRSAVLRVPSAVVASEWNFLLNPRHAAFGRLRIGKPKPWSFDPRLAR